MGCERVILYMTQDKCVYEVRVESTDASVAVREHVTNSNYEDGFSAKIIDERSEDDGVVFTIEVNGDAYEIPVFEEGFAEVPEAEVADADVSVGESKFA